MDRTQIISELCEQIIQRLEEIRADLESMQATNASNSKSTAGDKHDTERAMVHMEMETLSKRLDNEVRILNDLEGASQAKPTETAKAGSIVRTDYQLFFLGIAFGKKELTQTSIMGISIASPLGGQLQGAKSGDRIVVNGVSYQIESVF